MKKSVSLFQRAEDTRKLIVIDFVEAVKLS